MSLFLRCLYSFLVYLAIPFALLRLLWRSRKTMAYRQRWLERLGFFKISSKFQNGIWIHAVSVGETNVAIPLIRELQSRFQKYPIIVTTMTITGSERVTSVLGDSVFHIYVPYDIPCAVNRFLKKAKPKLGIIMETEVWPNLIYHSHRKNIPLMLANARLSERSAKGYARFGKYINQVFSWFSMIAAQAEPDADRFLRLGALKEKVKVVGSIKFDIKQSASTLEAGELLRQQLGADREVWIAASTRDDEEEIVLKAFEKVKERLPSSLLLLVPRHPERFGRVANRCRQHQFNVVLRSSDKPCDSTTDIFLGDSMGEMMLFYAASDVAFIGGSLVPLGGQNMLEPASFGLPIITGPHLFNFAEAQRLLQEARAITIVQDENELADKVIELFSSVGFREEVGARAKEVVDANRGALEKHLALISALLT